MKIIFFGSSDFAIPVLEALRGEEDVALVVTQPNRKKGRLLKVASTSIKHEAETRGIKTYQPDNINCKGSVGYLKKFNAELFVVISYGQILKKDLLDIPKLYSLNVHASMLPKYRGAAPIDWAIANGEKQTGVTVIKMNEKMDEGDIVLSETVSISNDDNAITLSKKLSTKGAALILDAIDLIKKGKVSFTKQNNSEASLAPKLKKQDGLIDWRWSADRIYNRMRAFVLWPGCFTYWNKRMLKIWKARPCKCVTSQLKPGTVLEVGKDAIVVNTGKGVLKIEELQLEGKRRMKVEEFIKGQKDMVEGTFFSLKK